MRIKRLFDSGPVRFQPAAIFDNRNLGEMPLSTLRYEDWVVVRTSVVPFLSYG